MIAEDNFIIREGCIVPRLNGEFSVVATVDNGEDAIAATIEHQPAILLLDVSMPGMNGFETARRVLSIQPGCKILLVTNYAEPAYVKAARKMELSGYVNKSRIDDELIMALHIALAGGFYESRF